MGRSELKAKKIPKVKFSGKICQNTGQILELQMDVKYDTVMLLSKWIWQQRLHAANNCMAIGSPTLTDKQIIGMAGKFWYPVFSMLSKKADINV